MNTATAPLLAMTADEWSFGFHDPTLAGWCLTTGYLVTAVLCFRARTHHQESNPPTARLWPLLAAGLALLAINKQLDLQSLLRFTGRDLTQASGIYEHKSFIRALVLGLAAAFILAGVLRWRRHLFPFFRTRPILIIGLLLLAIFVGLSALDIAQLHRLEQGGLPRGDWPGILEAGGLIIIAAAALRR